MANDDDKASSAQCLFLSDSRPPGLIIAMPSMANRPKQTPSAVTVRLDRVNIVRLPENDGVQVPDGIRSEMTLRRSAAVAASR